MIISQPKKVKRLQKYCPAALGMAFSARFLLRAKKQNSGFWNISNLGLCLSSFLNMSFKSKWDFWNTKIHWKSKFYGVWAELEMKICFLRQHVQSIVDSFTKFTKIGVLFEMFISRFFGNFLAQLPNFGFWVAGWGLAINSKLFKDFLEIS